MGVSIVIRPVTFQQIVPKLSQLVTAKRSSAKSNYVLIAPVTDTELKAVEAADVTTVNASMHHTSICDQTNNASVGRFLTAQDKGSGKVIYPVVVVELNGINAVPSFTLEQAVRMRPLPFWTISASDHFVKNSNA